ncbi:uncharacterized protein LOC125242273 [Leguminivora glycinivorella]|uniref:uncharacterized protein LOC125242273 n=1 Tax=Leguminivora glycinivorella TaxID=1035111 RepID=UPI00200C9A7D|nr:uncharacterized protein LOC125242273 [Leguminivora glycinivorella]XP_048006988.1 uncharacterized protein LOC125242273 [Leguminivora glycinivorella]
MPRLLWKHFLILSILFIITDCMSLSQKLAEIKKKMGPYRHNTLHNKPPSLAKIHEKLRRLPYSLLLPELSIRKNAFRRHRLPRELIKNIIAETWRHKNRNINRGKAIKLALAKPLSDHLKYEEPIHNLNLLEKFTTNKLRHVFSSLKELYKDTMSQKTLSKSPLSKKWLNSETGRNSAFDIFLSNYLKNEEPINLRSLSPIGKYADNKQQNIFSFSETEEMWYDSPENLLDNYPKDKESIYLHNLNPVRKFTAERALKLLKESHREAIQHNKYSKPGLNDQETTLYDIWIRFQSKLMADLFSLKGLQAIRSAVGCGMRRQDNAAKPDSPAPPDSSKAPDSPASPESPKAPDSAPPSASPQCLWYPYYYYPYYYSYYSYYPYYYGYYYPYYWGRR